MTAVGTSKTDPVGKDTVVGLVYTINREECKATYVGETSCSPKHDLENTGARIPPDQMSQNTYSHSPNHITTLENTKILSLEHKWFERGVKEVIYTRAFETFTS